MYFCNELARLDVALPSTGAAVICPVRSLSASGVTGCDRTDDDFLDYLHNNYIRNASRGALREVLRLYPSDPAAGSPFGTGDAFAYTPQYKRMSAFQGDFVLQAPRRLFVQQLSGRQPAWAYRG